jgi:hypothetical protein
MGPLVAAGLAVVPAITGAFQSHQANKDARIAAAKERRAQENLERFEASRQAVLNQAQDIRAMKSQVFNPYANLAVATQAADLKIEQTDQALANTLDQINRGGTGAGAATALARMAAASKAQVGASLENQEVKNQQLRVQGEASMLAQKMQLEQAALGAEAAAFGRQEARDLVSLDRLAGLQENAQAQQMMYEQQGAQALMGGIEGSVGLAGSFAEAGMFEES